MVGITTRDGIHEMLEAVGHEYFETYFRKVDELRKGLTELTGSDHTDGQVKLLTSCPACQQGLSRYTDESGLKPEYIVLETVRRLQGDNWQQSFVDRALNGGVEEVLL